ncbi:MAG TPA: aminopeptidase P family protein [Myxococcota bacterium]|nr:aminopeptidase P family protein [Myxococcota bacterium]
MNVPERIESLRKLMSEHDLRAYIVPSADPHQSEYVARCFRRRSFLSGFTGSAGTLVVCADKAGLWTDSRYFVQASRQLEGSGIELFKMGEPAAPELEAWLAAEQGAGGRVGLDPRLFSLNSFEKLTRTLEPAGVEILEVDDNLADHVWGAERPAPPAGEIRVHPGDYAGEPSGAKIERLRALLAERAIAAHVVCALDEIAWLFNLRGADVSYNPVFIAYAVVEKVGVSLFVDEGKLSPAARRALGGYVTVKPYSEIEKALSGLGRTGARVWLDPATCSRWIESRLTGTGAELIRETGPLPAWKAKKNTAEITGFRAAHLREGEALTRLLAWLHESAAGACEQDVVDKIEEIRTGFPEYIGPSFETIAACGPNGAIVHYGVTPESNRKLQPGEILLVDTGGQYTDGTTDATRTMALGSPSAEQRRAYTAVLKGHLLLSRSRFLAGADGYQLDVLARAPLWGAGLHYGHGTGHGVGAALCVHEGPFSVSMRKVLVPLEVGNVLSIEPGYYKEGAFGIRIENLALVSEREQTDSGTFLGFETLTLAPYERDLIEIDSLSLEDIEQINDYHQRVYEELASRLDDRIKTWLRKATRPL